MDTPKQVAVVEVGTGMHFFNKYKIADTLLTSKWYYAFIVEGEPTQFEFSTPFDNEAACRVDLLDLLNNHTFLGLITHRAA